MTYLLSNLDSVIMLILGVAFVAIIICAPYLSQ